MPPLTKRTFNAGLQFGYYHSKLVHFEAQKFFSMVKKALP